MAAESHPQHDDGIVQTRESPLEAPDAFAELEHLYRTAPVGLCLMDRNLRFVRVNDRLAKINGLPAAEHVGKHLREVLPDISADIEPVYRQVLGTGEPALNLEVARPDPSHSGGEHFYLVSYHPLKDDSDRVWGVGTVVQDITERRRVEMALRESEERLRSVLDTVTDFILSLDLKGDIQYINHTVPGLNRDEVIGTSGFDYLPSADRERFRQALEFVKESGAPREYEVKARGPHGSMVWYSCRVAPVKRGDEITGFTLVCTGISERKSAEAALWESEQRLRTIFEHAAVGVGLVDTRTGRFVRVNAKYAELIGYTPEEMQQKTFMEITHPDDLAGDLERMQRLHADEIREFAMEKRLVRKDGAEFWCHLTVSPTWEPGEEPRFHIAIVKDISSRKSNEAAVRASEKKYRQLIETTREGVWVIDASGLTTFVNERMSEMLGYDSDELMGRSLFDFMDERAQVDARANLDRRQDGISEQHDFCLRRKDGADLWTSMATNPLTDDEGCYVGALAMVTDITERKNMERELKLSHIELGARVCERTAELTAANRLLRNEIVERKRIDEERERLISIIEAAPDFIGFADAEGRMRYLNEAARRSLGVSDQQSLDVRIQDLYPDWSNQVIEQEGMPAALSEGSWRGEVAWLTGEKKELPISLMIQTHVSPAGEQLISVIARDISDLKDAEQAVQRAERLASVGTLAAGIAHEINNPLGAMLLTAEYAQRKLDDRAVVEESLSGIVGQVERCASIVRSVLQFSRGGYAKRWHKDLAQVLRRSQDLTRQHSFEAGVRVELDIDGQECFAHLNPIEMEQVFVNLIDNAIQSSPRNDRVQVRLEANGNSLRVIVQDHGQGMPANVKSRIFDPFFTTRSRAGGTGLGMSIVHGIIRDHDGDIDVWSEPDQGTRITVTLPRIPLGQNYVQDLDR